MEMYRRISRTGRPQPTGLENCTSCEDSTPRQLVLARLVPGRFHAVPVWMVHLGLTRAPFSPAGRLLSGRIAFLPSLSATKAEILLIDRQPSPTCLQTQEKYPFAVTATGCRRRSYFSLRSQSQQLELRRRSSRCQRTRPAVLFTAVSPDGNVVHTDGAGHQGLLATKLAPKAGY